MIGRLVPFLRAAPGDSARLHRERVAAGRASIGLHEMLGGTIEEFNAALAARDLRTARQALAAIVAFDPPAETPLAALSWRGRQINLLALKLVNAEFQEAEARS